jgi:hypothetical protein
MGGSGRAPTCGGSLRQRTPRPPRPPVGTLGHRPHTPLGTEPSGSSRPQEHLPAASCPARRDTTQGQRTHARSQEDSSLFPPLTGHTGMLYSHVEATATRRANALTTHWATSCSFSTCRVCPRRSKAADLSATYEPVTADIAPTGELGLHLLFSAEEELVPYVTQALDESNPSRLPGPSAVAPGHVPSTRSRPTCSSIPAYAVDPTASGDSRPHLSPHGWSPRSRTSPRKPPTPGCPSPQ